MNTEQLTALKEWFAAYCSSFSTPVREVQRNLSLKEDHTREVCRNIVRIGRDLGLRDEELLLAEAAALFHDVGRFPQYRQYRTFVDADSVNHAAVGAKVLLDERVLEELPRGERELILRTVTLHNVFLLPDGLDAETLLFARMIRDADKIDILRVAIDYYGQDDQARADAVALGLPDTPRFSPAVLSCVGRGRMVRMTDLTTVNDFKLLQLAWLYDLNFASSFRTVRERRYVDRLAACLPPDEGIGRAVERVRKYVDERIAAD